MKIPKDVQPRTYELTYLIPDGFTDAERSQIDEEIATMVQKKYKGKVAETEDWGKKRMAYKIKHNNVSHTQAYYTYLMIEMDPEHAPELERALQIHDKVMRHLLVKAEPRQEAAAPAPAAE